MSDQDFLYYVPAQLPPPGVKSNFEDPVTRSPQLRVVLLICLFLMWSMFLVRIYVKLSMKRVFSLDDGAGSWCNPFEAK